jgi:hypothetical protein
VLRPDAERHRIADRQHPVPDLHAHRDRSADAIDADGVLLGCGGVIVRDAYAVDGHLLDCV